VLFFPVGAHEGASNVYLNCCRKKLQSTSFTSATPLTYHTTTIILINTMNRFPAICFQVRETTVRAFVSVCLLSHYRNNPHGNLQTNPIDSLLASIRILCILRRQDPISKLVMKTAMMLHMVFLALFTSGHAPVTNKRSATHELGHDVQVPWPDLVQSAGWKPDMVASPAEIQKYASKGGFLHCLLDMTDENAGNAWPGRTPPSVSSPWKGTLEGTYAPLLREQQASVKQR